MPAAAPYSLMSWVTVFFNQTEGIHYSGSDRVGHRRRRHLRGRDRGGREPDY